MPESTTAALTIVAVSSIPTEHSALVAYLRNLPDRDRARVVDLLTAKLREQGHPDALAAACDMVERAAAEIEDGPAEAIPTDPQALYEYLCKLTPGGQCEVADRLAVQLGGTPEAIERAVDLVDDALRAIAYEDLVARLRADLAEQLDTAADAVQAARNAIDRLTADDVDDVRYADGGRRVRDLCAFLDDAGRMIRAAAALNPCPPDTTGGA